MIMDGIMRESCADVPDAVPCCRCAPSYEFQLEATEEDSNAVATVSADAIVATARGTYLVAREMDEEDTREEPA